MTNADKIGTTTLLAGVATLVLPFVAMAFLGPCSSGGVFGPLVVLFPDAAISVFLLNDPGCWFWLLMFGQFPCYAFVLASGWIKHGLLPASLFVLGIHLVSIVGATIVLVFSK